MNRVLITGIGAITPYGIGITKFIEGVYTSRSAVVSMKSQWETKIKDLNCWLGAPLSECVDEKLIPRKFRRFMGPPAIYSALAAEEAVNDSGITREVLSSGKAGVSFASTMASVIWMENMVHDVFEKSSIRDLPSGLFFKIMSHSCASNIAHYFNIIGKTIAPNAACASAALSIGVGYETIKNGEQDIMICGGADELHFLVNASFDLVGAASTHFNDSPSNSPRPFDKDRDGTVCGEGCGALILESEESAKARGAKIYGEVVGFSTSADGSHLAEPHKDSILYCIKNALDNSRLSPKEIQFINAHATGTILGDLAEAQALEVVFGNNQPPISSYKGYFGHTLGASAALEMILSLAMMRDEIISPTLNLESPGEGCENLNHVLKTEKRKIDCFIKNSFAFGGINSVLIVKRY